LVNRLQLLRVVGSLDDILGGGGLLLDVGLLEDLLGWPAEWLVDRDGFPALARQQIWGIQPIEQVITRMIDAGSKVDGEGTFGDIVGVEGLLGGERCPLTVGELDQHSGTKGQEGFGRVFVEDWLGFVEGPVRGNCRVESGLGRVVELVSDKGLEMEDQGGTEAVGESS